MHSLLAVKKQTLRKIILFSFCLTLSYFLFSLAYALPFQAPVAGAYSCFSSEKSIFDENAQDIGATLTITANGSYTFTTSNASENGTVTVSEDTSNALEATFQVQSGSILKIQPSSSKTAYDGMFVIDKQGGMYILLQNNNGLNIRCQSPSAAIANLVSQPTQSTNPQEPTSQPLRAGSLCRNSSRKPNHDQRSFTTIPRNAEWCLRLFLQQ